MKSTRSIFPKIKNPSFLETIQCVSGGTEKVVYASESSFQLIKSAKSSGGDHSFLCHKVWYGERSQMPSGGISFIELGVAGEVGGGEVPDRYQAGFLFFWFAFQLFLISTP